MLGAEINKYLTILSSRAQLDEQDTAWQRFILLCVLRKVLLVAKKEPFFFREQMSFSNSNNTNINK